MIICEAHTECPSCGEKLTATLTGNNPLRSEQWAELRFTCPACYGTVTYTIEPTIHLTPHVWHAPDGLDIDN